MEPKGAPSSRGCGRWRSIPVLTDGDLVLPESTTIIEYIDDGTLVPDLQARLWDRFADQHLSTPMQKIVGDVLRPEGRTDPEGVAQARRALDTAYGVLDDRLADRPWAGGETFTIADCAAFPALFYLRAIHRWERREHHALLPRPARATDHHPRRGGGAAASPVLPAAVAAGPGRPRTHLTVGLRARRIV